MIREVKRNAASGYLMLLISIALMAFSIWLFIASLGAVGQVLAAVVLFVVSIILMSGVFVVNPNQARVLQLFGKYVGSAYDPGLRWANPFYSKRKVSVRVRNFETGKLKVNDNAGNPVEIAAVVVWQVVDTAEALFNVDDYVDFVHVQSEAALRNLASQFPYVAHGEDDEKALVSHTAEISELIKGEVQDRLDKAGVKVLESKISHLAYSPEIAAAMLRRQQASAVVAARQQIVDGAVGMVETALTELSKKKVLEFDDERKAAMVSNLMVVLCSDRDPQPVVNTGTLHH